MNLQNRIAILIKLGEYLESNSPEWEAVKQNAFSKNPWFTDEFVEMAKNNIVQQFLQPQLLENWCTHYSIPNEPKEIKNIGIVMAGNIPMVGFHDFLSVFISGHRQTIKLSSKDDILLKHFIEKLLSWDDEIKNLIVIADQLKQCDAYIATGSNQSAGYFETYFGKYPNIIRKNRTSIAVLDGSETEAELLELSNDVHLYFGLGCRNVSKIYVPKDYDFVSLLRAFDNFNSLGNHHKFRNNYDYQLSICLINSIPYMSNECTILLESKLVHAPISVLYYEFYDAHENPIDKMQNHNELQCIIGKNHLPFGKSQVPGLFDYADDIDTIEFLKQL
jgi:hypothetical protein